MKVLYNKYTDYRKKEYQIYTQIVEENGEKMVCKKPVYQVGKAHIQNFFRNCNKLSEIYDEQILKPLPCQLRDGGVWYAFLKGKSYQKSLEELCRKKNKKGILEFLKKYMTIIEGKKDKQVPFHATKEFNEWFGNGDAFEGMLACEFTNLDCNVGNLIEDDNATWIMDYEWCFDFPVPLDFVKYLNISWLYDFDVPLIKDLYSKQELLEICKIEGDVDVYKRMEQNHGNHIDIESDTEVNMLHISKASLHQPIFNPGEIILEFHQLDAEDVVIEKTRVVKQIDGISRHMSNHICVNPQTCKIMTYILDSGVISLKWITIQSSEGGIQFKPLNGYYDGEYVFFDSKVPVMDIYANGKVCQEITFSAHVYQQFDDDLIDIYHRNALIRNERNSMELQIKGLNGEKANLEQQLVESQARANDFESRYTTIYHSRSWQIMLKLQRIINVITRRK